MTVFSRGSSKSWWTHPLLAAALYAKFPLTSTIAMEQPEISTRHKANQEVGKEVEDLYKSPRTAGKNFDIWINHGLYSFNDDGVSVNSSSKGRKRSKC